MVDEPWHPRVRRSFDECAISVRMERQQAIQRRENKICSRHQSQESLNHQLQWSSQPMVAADVLSFSNEQTRNSKLLWRLRCRKLLACLVSRHGQCRVTKVPI